MKQKEEKEKNGKKVVRSFVGIFNGNILTREGVIIHLPYLLFLAFLALLYIANGYLAEDTVRELNRVDNNLKEFRSEYITTKSDLMYKSKQSQIAKIIEQKELGLKESYYPPKKIVVKN